MPRGSLADLMAEGDHLVVTVEANGAELAFLDPTRLQLRDALDALKATSVRQDVFRAQFQQSTRDLEKLFAECRDLITRLRNGVRMQYGLRQEKLVEFGLQPRRRRAPKTKPPETGTTPPPAPANQG